MGSAEIARWLDEHNALAGSTAASTSHVYLWAAYGFVGACIALLAYRRQLRIQPGQLFALLGIEALLATVLQPPGRWEIAGVLFGGGILCFAEILVVRDAARRTERETQERQTALLKNMEALEKALVAQFQMDALGIRAALEKSLLDIRTAADQTDKALISHQLWDLVANLSGIAKKYFNKFAEAQSIPPNLSGTAWIAEKARRESAALAVHTEVLKEYNLDRRNQVVNMRNTLNAKYGICNDQLDSILGGKVDNAFEIGAIAQLLTLMACKLGAD